ncbi:MAG: Uma2 family endonuclease [Chloroflexi bacterium]|nr:Uma2 family endonuclease [Chloroflexota bacterium]
MKRKLYARRGIGDYWIVDWQQQILHGYRLERGDLRLVRTLSAADRHESPLLPGFSLALSQLCAELP